MTAIEQFFQWMFDQRDFAATELGMPEWATLRPELCVLFRPEDKPRLTNRHDYVEMVLEDAVMTKIAQGAELLARPKADGGLGDIQAFHALMLLMRTGRRINEVLMMDFDPLEKLLRATPPAASDDLPQPDAGGSAFVARLRYQQTKIDLRRSASIPVDEEVVSIIRAQQRHARQLMADRGNPDLTPRYLFLAGLHNRNGDGAYPMGTMHLRLNHLAKRLTITDSAGRPVRISKTHQFRHTSATNLLNGGVPLHVVMRYFGHLSADMTLHYAVTLAKTQEEQFLRFKKVNSDGRSTAVDAADMLDLIQLDRRTDRMLPNGWCLLPPKQFCDKGNACLPVLFAVRHRRVTRAGTAQTGRRHRGVDLLAEAGFRRPLRRTDGPEQRLAAGPPGRSGHLQPDRPGHYRRQRPRRPRTRGFVVTAEPLMDGAPRTTSLVRSARARRQNAEAKAEKALSDLASTGQPVTFAAVARAAGVSSDFLYRHPAFRDRIAQLRTTGSAGRPGDPSGVEQQATSSGSASAAVRALSAQIKQMRRDHLAELSTLRQALENAHGENLTLRRRLKLDPPSTQ